MGFELAIRIVRPGLTRPIGHIKRFGSSYRNSNCISANVLGARPISTGSNIVVRTRAGPRKCVSDRAVSGGLDAFLGQHMRRSVRTFSRAGSGPDHPLDVITEDFELTSSVSADRWFKGYILDSDNLVPKVLPIFKSCDILEGDGGVGTVKKLVFTIGDFEHFSKHRTDILDETNRVFKFTVVEGGDLGDEFEFIENTVKIEPGPNGGSVYKCSTVWHAKSDDQSKIQETIKRATEGSKAFFQAVDAYLQTHPNQYI